MIYTKARYKVKKTKINEVKKAIKEFVTKVKKEHGTLLYEAYQEQDKKHFTHLMIFKNKKAEEFHRKTQHVKKFVEILYPNCEEEPIFTKLSLAASTK